MRQNTLQKLAATLLSSLFLLCSCTSERTKYIQVEGFAQGGTYHVILNLPKGIKGERARTIIDSTLTAIDNSLSGYNKGSILSKVNGGERVALDSLFIKTFNISKEIWLESGGSFDPSASPLFDLWGFGFKNKESITQSKIDSILQFVGMDKVYIEQDPSDGKSYLHKSDPRITLNFNAIAQGLTCDFVAREIERIGCDDYLVEVGREILCKGKSARGGAWRVGLDKPVDGNMDEGKDMQEIIELTDKGIVTSGNYRKFYVENGQKYAHTINPVSGYPAKHNLLSATVITKDAATADAYATWFMVVGLDAAKEIISQRDDIEAYLIYGSNEEMEVWHTDNLILNKK